MNAKEFFFAVKRMREAQKDYFKTRNPYHLDISKRLEKVIDDEIARVNAILNKRPQVVQGDLFGEGQS